MVKKFQNKINMPNEMTWPKLHFKQFIHSGQVKF